MKGKSIFTPEEITELKMLIKLRMKSERSAQKVIRDKMRKIGLYGKDDWGITDMKPADLDSLIDSGRIKVVNGSKVIPAKSIQVQKKPKLVINKGFSDPVDVSHVLKTFNSNRFDPASDNSFSLPDCAGNYLVCLKTTAKLPAGSLIPQLKEFNGFKVIYTGIAGASLRSRDYKAHFTGHAGRSTLRKSLGVLFGYKLIPRDSDPTTGKTKFCETDENTLTKWMRENLLLFFLPTTDYDRLETVLIEYFNPPLNLQGCNSQVNRDFRAMLSTLRSLKS